MKKLKKNNGVFYVAISLLGVLAIGTGVLAYSISKNITVNGDYNNYEAASNVQDSGDMQLGSAAGNTFDSLVNFYKNFVKGGNTTVVSSTLYIARSITAGEVCNNKTLVVNSSSTINMIQAASLDLTLPSTSTIFADCLKNEGDEITFDLVNESVTAATTTEIVAGAGCQLFNGVADGDNTIPGQKGATVTIKRINDWPGTASSTLGKDCLVWVYEWN